MTPAVLNIDLPSSAFAITFIVPSPAGYGQAHFIGHLVLVEPPPAAPPAVLNTPPPTPTPAPAVLLPAPEEPLPLPAVAVVAGLRSLLPLLPQAATDANAAVPQSSTATAQERDFEEDRMGLQITSERIQVNAESNSNTHLIISEHA